MVSLFKENVPATNSALQSSEIRDNFTALFDKVKTLEVRATDPTSTSVLVLGGPVYFRSSASQQLKLINFNTRLFDITNTFGYKSKKDTSGNLFREAQAFRGPSAFESEGLLLEILITLKPNGQLVFTESTTAQSNRLSSPFNIYFDDSEIPVALLFLEKTSDGVLQVIEDIDITDARPVITTAFQNNPQTAELQDQVEDNTTRIDLLEPALRVTDALKGRLPPSAKLLADATNLTNTKIEILSGTAREGTDGYQLLFAGGTVDFAVGAVTSGRNFTASTPATTANYWRRALIGLQFDSASTDPTENAKLVITHGAEGVTPDQVGAPTVPAKTVPLTKVLYRMKTDASNIRPLISLVDVDGFRLNHEFPIVALTSVPATDEAFITLQADLSGTGFSSGFVTTSVFLIGDPVEIFDDNSRSVRRTISSVSFNITNNIATVTVTDSFVEVSLLRNPKVRSVKLNVNLIEDIRPFIGIS